MLSRPSHMRIDPSTLIQLASLYFVRTRYSWDWRGLMRVNALSALINSVSKLIRQLVMGCAHRPNTPAYSLIRVSPGFAMGFGVTNVNEPSPFGVQPGGKAPPTKAQSPRLALFGKKTSVTFVKKLSSMARWRYRNPARAPAFGENW